MLFQAFRPGHAPPLTNQRHVSLTKTARGPGTPQHQAASGCDWSVPKRAAALGSQRPVNLLGRYEQDGQYQKRGGNQAGVAPWCSDHAPMRTKLRPITAHLHQIPELVVIERWRTEHGRGTRRRRRDRHADAALKAGLNASAALEKRRLIRRQIMLVAPPSGRPGRVRSRRIRARPSAPTLPQHHSHALPSAPNGNQRNG